jgi:hypothetical protein
VELAVLDRDPELETEAQAETPLSVLRCLALQAAPRDRLGTLDRAELRRSILQPLNSLRCKAHRAASRLRLPSLGRKVLQVARLLSAEKVMDILALKASMLLIIRDPEAEVVLNLLLLVSADQVEHVVRIS